MVGCRTIIGTIGGCGGLLALYRWEDSAVVPRYPLWWLDTDAVGGRTDADGLLTTRRRLGAPGSGMQAVDLRNVPLCGGTFDAVGIRTGGLGSPAGSGEHSIPVGVGVGD